MKSAKSFFSFGQSSKAPSQQKPQEQIEVSGFETRAPSPQNALDLMEGLWKSRFPKGSQLHGGDQKTFENGIVARIERALPGAISGSNILEIGPFEAYYTYQLEQAGAASVLGIEVNRINFLKCLVVKEALDLKARFLLGDFANQDLASLGRFDFCFAAGVLYHQRDPIAFLERLLSVSDRVYIWTHVFDESVFHLPQAKGYFNPSMNRTVQSHGREITLHYRSYKWIEGTVPAAFSGGPQDFAFWLSEADLHFILSARGFEVVKKITGDGQHPAGPFTGFVAARKPG